MQKTAAEGSWGTIIPHKTGKRATLVGYDSYYLSTHTKKRSPRILSFALPSRQIIIGMRRAGASLTLRVCIAKLAGASLTLRLCIRFAPCLKLAPAR